MKQNTADYLGLIIQIYNHTRGSGYTSAISHLAAITGGTLMCPTRIEASSVSKNHPDTLILSLDDNVAHRWRLFKGPVFLDNHLITDIMSKARSRIAALEKEVQELKKCIEQMD